VIFLLYELKPILTRSSHALSDQDPQNQIGADQKGSPFAV
jgi:hypothetical protein